MKAALRKALTLRPVSKVTVGVARALPGTWQKRLPVNVPMSQLQLDDGGKVSFAQPHRCQIAQEIFWGDGQLDSAQDRHALQAAIAFSGSAATFLDIGSYTGLFALAVARSNPRIQSYAYEIVGENYLLLWENVLHNDLSDRVHPRLVAVGGESGEIRIPYAQSSGQLASSVDIGGSTDHGVRVPVKRLDDLHLESTGPVALKIDVEGFEMEIFDGAKAFLTRHRPDMVCEVLRRAKRVPEMMELLGNLGYRWFHIRENGFARRDTIVADKFRRDWIFSCKSDEALRALGLELID